MIDKLSIEDFEKWLMSEDNPHAQLRAVASFVGTDDFIVMEPVKKEITCHYLANLVLIDNFWLLPYLK